ncbi:MAG: UDP-3-O-acylglucosamine N-acyltransferase [Paracidovorax wautersii]|uniref:UDP-3-O-acylglucosamine N-acyltransferase n=1 Tax=Paracidovorax wautersii TaxID=1177982 RepID=A0A7V8FS46_9BURK|nr:MAG: UDP-3-O-acylglucosamine N-acyltransferase [Paracidovorax wautersii]
MSVRLSDIVGELGGELVGGDGLVIERLAPLDVAQPGDLAFLSSPKFRSQLVSSQAGCVIVSPRMKEAALKRGSCIVTPDPYLYYARVTQLWQRLHAPRPAAGIHPTAHVDETAVVAPSATIGALAYIGPRAVIGEGVIIGVQATVEEDAFVGAHSQIKARAVLGARCRIGQRCVLNQGAVVGGDGFGFAPDNGTWVKIEQLGIARLGDDVEIGINTCVDRGALGDTIIEDGVKLDNLIQVAHNVRIGKHTAMAGCVGIAGSCDIGAYCTIGGAAMLGGHMKIVDRVNISAGTLVSRSILQPGNYTGIFPFADNGVWRKNAAVLRNLSTLRDRVKFLEEQAGIVADDPGGEPD